MNPLPRTAVELRDALRAGEVTAVEAVEAYLDRIDAGHRLGSFITTTGERALQDAEDADRRRAAGHPAPALHGLPLAHKDLVEVAGVPTTRGSAAFEPIPAARDAPSVAVLRRAGAISLGKTQVPELGLTGYSENLISAPARNPSDETRTAGGSSGGTAAAVAAGLLPVAPGSDGGGSIRIPSLACGLIGLKPGLGAIPSDLARGTTDEFGAPRLTVNGPIARSVADAAMLFDAMRGASAACDEDGHPPEPALGAVASAAELTGLRIGISTLSPFESAHPVPLAPESRAAFELAARRLEGLGHRVSEADFHYDPRYPAEFTAAWTASLSLLRLTGEQESRLVPFTRHWRERALARGRDRHRAAGGAMRAFGADARAQWGRYDAVLTPGLARLPPLVGEFLALAPEDDYRLQCEWAPYASMVNVSGLPAIAVPILRTTEGVPMGVQLIGRPGSEIRLLQLAEQLTAEAGPGAGVPPLTAAGAASRSGSA